MGTTQFMGIDTDQTIQNKRMKAVSDLPAGTHSVVCLLRGGNGFIRRMVALGFTPGVEVTVMQNYGHGPMLLVVRNTCIALGRNEALKVLVEVL